MLRLQWFYESVTTELIKRFINLSQRSEVCSDRTARHSIKLGSLWILHQDDAFLFRRVLNAQRAVASRARKHNANGAFSSFGCQRLKQQINRKTRRIPSTPLLLREVQLGLSQL